MLIIEQPANPAASTLVDKPLAPTLNLPEDQIDFSHMPKFVSFEGAIGGPLHRRIKRSGSVPGHRRHFGVAFLLNCGVMRFAGQDKARDLRPRPSSRPLPLRPPSAVP